MRQFLSSLIFASLFSFSTSSPEAAPRFSGVAEALPAPGAVYLHWPPATGSSGSVTYNIYTGTGESIDYSNPVESVQSPDWALTGLPPGREIRVAVRARDNTGEENNTRSIAVTPGSTMPEAEWRGVWVNRFEWAGGSRRKVEQRLDTMFSTLAEARLNAVLFQVRGQGDTMYPSETEPWSNLVSESARSFDPVEYAITKARENKIQFHAWMNLSTIWQSGSKVPPEDKDHPFYQFADESDPKRRLGVTHDSQGRPHVWGKDGYVWLTHGNPRVNSYLRRQVHAFLEEYPVQGLHWDDRTGNPNGTSRDPVSVHRFEGRGNPMKISDFGEWQRDQLSRFLSDVYTLAKMHNPRILVSASPFGIADKTRIPGYRGYSDADDFGVEPEKWLRMGVLDALMPQVYWAQPEPGPHYGTLVRDWVAHNRTGRPIWPGSNLRKFGSAQPLDPVQVRYVALTRALGLNGNQFYNWSAITPSQWRADGPKLYPTPARVPTPRHMRPGQVGQIVGTLLDADGSPIVDGWIRIKGRRYIHLSGADGYFGIPNLKPGTHEVQFTRGDGNVQSRQVNVTADRTTTLRMTLE